MFPYFVRFLFKAKMKFWKLCFGEVVKVVSERLKKAGKEGKVGFGGKLAGVRENGGFVRESW